ncbi:MAG: hypothetical protein HP049_01750 [Clostridiales bacterium]|nr:hypothetical protein [Clostridiales bacterium]
MQLFQRRLYFLRRELRGGGDGFAGRGAVRGLAGQDAERAKGLEDVYIRQRREPLRDAGKLFFGGLVPEPVKAGKQAPAAFAVGEETDAGRAPAPAGASAARAPLGGVFLPTVPEQVVYGNAEIIRQFRKVLDVRAAFPRFP